MMQRQPQLLNAGLSGNNSARRCFCPKQERILQDGKITFHDWKTDCLDDFAQSKAVRMPVSDLQTIGLILQKNVFTRPLIGDHAPDANPQFVRIIPVILQDTSQRAERQFRNRRGRQVINDEIRLLRHKYVNTDNLPEFTVKGSGSGASDANRGPDQRIRNQVRGSPRVCAESVAARYQLQQKQLSFLSSEPDHTGDFNPVSILSPRHQPLDRDLLGFGQRSGPQLVPFRRIDVSSESTGVTDTSDLNNIPNSRSRVRVVHEHTAG